MSSYLAPAGTVWVYEPSGHVYMVLDRGHFDKVSKGNVRWCFVLTSDDELTSFQTFWQGSHWSEASTRIA